MKMNKKAITMTACALVVFLLFCLFHYLSPFVQALYLRQRPLQAFAGVRAGHPFQSCHKPVILISCDSLLLQYIAVHNLVASIHPIKGLNRDARLIQGF